MINRQAKRERTWLILILLLALYGAVGSMDMIDQLQQENAALQQTQCGRAGE